MPDRTEGNRLKSYLVTYEICTSSVYKNVSFLVTDWACVETQMLYCGKKKKKEFLSQLQGKNYFYGNTNIAYDFFRQKASGHYFPI